MFLIDQTVSSQTRSLWHQRAFLLLTIAFTPLLISHSQLEQANMRLLGVHEAARLLVLHLLLKQVERKDVLWSTQPSPIAACS